MTRPPAPLARLLTLAVLLLAACDGSSDPTSLDDLPPDLVATWYATSLSFDGRDVFDEGMRMTLTFRSDGSYDAAVSRDLVEFVCEGEWDCEDGGTFGATQTEITFDPGDPWETTLSASLTGTDLRLTGTLDGGQSVDLRFVMPPIPEIIGTWTSTALLTPDGDMVYGEVPTTLALHFEVDGTFSYASTASSPDDFCDPMTSCTGQGLYTVDGETGQVTFDPGTPDPTTMQVEAGPGTPGIVLSNGQMDWWFERVEIPTPGVEGDWYAISMMRGGQQIADPYGWNTQNLRFENGTYQIVSVHGDLTEDFMCQYDTEGRLDCTGVMGSYVAGLGSVTLSESIDATLSVESTPVSLRLSGTIQGVAADILYARIPRCGTWTAAMC